jgi:hypothetical protein
VVSVDPSHQHAAQMLDHAANVFESLTPRDDWPWPEPRLSYANAVIPEAMLAIGAARDRADLVERGLFLLEWLVDRQTNDGHLSVVPTGGAGPRDSYPAFDQQPIEAAALADACARAAVLTDQPSWVERLRRAVDWFTGDNDGRVSMIDPATGGGYDGLTRTGPNLNEGAESTLALLSTLQHARNDVLARS